MGLAIVVPCLNEESSLRRLAGRLRRTLLEITEDFEVVLVDDGSTDGTLTAMRELAAGDPRFRYVALSRNFGKEAAMLAGLRHAEADVVGIMDADLQDPPELLAQMVKLLEDGYDQVVARRDGKGMSWARGLVTRVFYRVANRMVDVELQDGIGDFRVLSKKAVEALLSLDEINRFSKGLFSWIGFDTAVVDYQNVWREDGRSRWSFGQLVDYAVDGVVSFNNKPLRTAIYLGALFTLLAFGYAGWVLADAVVNGNPVPGYVTIMCGVAVFAGIQLVILGVIGEYLGRIYLETKRRPHFVVKEHSPPRSPGAVS